VKRSKEGIGRPLEHFYGTILAEAVMATTFVLVAAGGIAMGFRFRSNLLATASILVLAFCALSILLNDGAILSGIAFSLGLLAALQAGYLLGLVLSCLLGTQK
jgi:hypothetical protein